MIFENIFLQGISIHDRMPVVLGKENVKAWMDPDTNPAEVVKTALTDMYYEKAT